MAASPSHSVASPRIPLNFEEPGHPGRRVCCNRRTNVRGTLRHPGYRAGTGHRGQRRTTQRGCGPAARPLGDEHDGVIETGSVFRSASRRSTPDDGYNRACLIALKPSGSSHQVAWRRLGQYLRRSRRLRRDFTAREIVMNLSIRPAKAITPLRIPFGDGTQNDHPAPGKFQ